MNEGLLLLPTPSSCCRQTQWTNSMRLVKRTAKTLYLLSQSTVLCTPLLGAQTLFRHSPLGWTMKRFVSFSLSHSQNATAAETETSVPFLISTLFSTDTKIYKIAQTKLNSSNSNIIYILTHTTENDIEVRLLPVSGVPTKRSQISIDQISTWFIRWNKKLCRFSLYS